MVVIYGMKVILVIFVIGKFIYDGLGEKKYKYESNIIKFLFFFIFVGKIRDKYSVRNLMFKFKYLFWK